MSYPARLDLDRLNERGARMPVGRGKSLNLSANVHQVQVPLDTILVEALEGAEVYAVGGRVRDEFRQPVDGEPLKPKDLDYVVCDMQFDRLTERLRAIGRVDVVGASFSVVKFRHEAGQADIALPRRERSTGSGHREFTVESGPHISIDDDLGRRDFRMNMIARRLRDGLIVDPYDGIGDIAQRRIDILTEQAFLEDPLRMLRAAQFSARFEFLVTDRSRAAMASTAQLAKTISPERIADELNKMFEFAAVPSIGLELMRETGSLAEIWPELLEGVGVDQNEWHAYDVYRHNVHTLDAVPPGDVILRLASLLHDVGKPRTKDGPHFYRHEHVGSELTREMLGRLRFPSATAETITHLVRFHMYQADPELAPKAIRRFINRIEPEHLDRLFKLRAADIVGSGLPKRDDANERFEARVYTILGESPAATIRDLAIRGFDVIELMQRAGIVSETFSGDRRVGQILRRLFDDVVDDPELNERSRLLAKAAEIIAGETR